MDGGGDNGGNGSPPPDDDPVRFPGRPRQPGEGRRWFLIGGLVLLALILFGLTALELLEQSVEPGGH